MYTVWRCGVCAGDLYCNHWLTFICASPVHRSLTTRPSTASTTTLSFGSTTARSDGPDTARQSLSSRGGASNDRSNDRTLGSRNDGPATPAKPSADLSEAVDSFVASPEAAPQGRSVARRDDRGRAGASDRKEYQKERDDDAEDKTAPRAVSSVVGDGRW